MIDQGMFNLPVGSGSADLIAVKYPAEPSALFATWGGQKKPGPLLLSTGRRGFGDGKPIPIFFTDVAVKVTKSDKWMIAQ